VSGTHSGYICQRLLQMCSFVFMHDQVHVPFRHAPRPMSRISGGGRSRTHKVHTQSTHTQASDALVRRCPSCVPVCACVCAYVCACVNACLFSCLRVRVHVCVYVRARACVCVRARLCVRARVQARGAGGQETWGAKYVASLYFVYATMTTVRLYFTYARVRLPGLPGLPSLPGLPGLECLQSLSLV
jgi:hypothetical protein